MSSAPEKKALVTVLEDIETAHAIIEALHKQGYSLDKIELVTHSVRAEAPEIGRPELPEKTADSLINAAGKGAGLGATAGLIAAVFAPFPGVGLAMILAGGLVGGAFGGIAGLDHASEDISVDLPSVDEYEQLVKDGHSLVVVQGSHDDVTRAAAIIEDMPLINYHVHRLHGHDVHEHPSQDS